MTKTYVGRPQRERHLGRYEELLQQERLDEWGQLGTVKSAARMKARKHRKKLRTAGDEGPADDDDGKFSTSSSESESVGSGCEEISNDEVFPSQFCMLFFFLTLASGCFASPFQVCSRAR